MLSFEEIKTVSIRGYDIVRLGKGNLSRLYGKEEIWMDYLDWDYDMCCMSKQPKNEEMQVCGHHKFGNLFPDQAEDRWYKIASKYTMIPNGQVKNFLVCLRTYSGGMDKVKILVKGSRGFRGGLWHNYYIASLLQVDSQVEIDFYDYLEISSEEKGLLGEKSFHARWINGPYLGSGEGYDVIIDDAWTPGKGAQTFTSKASTFSYKQPFEGKPFLHFSETRFFSSPPKDFFSSCKCLLCSAITDSVWSYHQYFFVRACCVALGHHQHCISVPASHDLVNKGYVLKRIYQEPSIVIDTPKDLRAILSLMTEYGLVPIEPNRVVLTSLSPYSYLYEHSKGFTPDSAITLQPTLDFSGQSVLFFGLPPSVIHPLANIKRSSNLDGSFDHVFVSSLQAYFHSPVYTNSIWIQNLDDLQKFPMLRVTGRTYTSFHECWLNDNFVAPPKLPVVDVESTDDFSFEDPQTILLPRVESNIGPFYFASIIEKRMGKIVSCNWKAATSSLEILDDYFSGDLSEKYFSSIKKKKALGTGYKMMFQLSRSEIFNTPWGSFNHSSLCEVSPSPYGVPAFRIRGKEGSLMYKPKNASFSFLNGQFLLSRWYPAFLPETYLSCTFDYFYMGGGKKKIYRVKINVAIPRNPFLVWHQLWFEQFQRVCPHTVQFLKLPPEVGEHFEKEDLEYLFPNNTIWGVLPPKEED
jgi:hypothetical protein